LEHTKIPYSYGDIRFETVFDEKQDRYLLMIVGREPAYGLSLDSTRRVHGCLIHVDIIDGKFWIQRDGTEEGIATDLIKEGISRNRIVLAFRSEQSLEEELTIN
ncbi:MAG: XisI protein, partial [Microcystaceae cyanobacterium]